MPEPPPKLDDVQSIINKLKELYDKQDKLLVIAEELNEEIEVLEYMLMYKYNAQCRKNSIIKNKWT